MGFISWIRKWWFGKETTDYSTSGGFEVIVRPDIPKEKEFPKAKRYIIHTAEGGKFCCKGQKAVADTLEALYNCGIDRNRIHNAMMHHKGRIVIDNKYIATVKCKKEK